MSIAEERIRNIRKKRNKKQKTFLSKGLGKISKLLAVAVLIHYILVLFQGDYHPMINSAREWIITYIYNGPLAGLVQPACAKIWGWKYSTLLYDFTGLPALILSVAAFLAKRHIERIDVISDDESRQYASWRSGGTYKTPSVPLWRRGRELLIRLYSREGMDLAHEAEEMAVCRIIYDGREASQDMNTVREWRLDELIRRAGTKIKVEYDRQEKKMTLLLPDGSIKILNKGESFTWGFGDNKLITAMFL